MADFGIRNTPLDQSHVFRNLHQRILTFQNSNNKEKENTLFWVIPSAQNDAGALYVITPVYIANKLEALLGTEQNIRLEDFTNPSTLPVGVTLLNDNNEVLMTYTENGGELPSISGIPNDDNYFGYNSGYDTLLLKKEIESVRAEHHLFIANQRIA